MMFLPFLILPFCLICCGPLRMCLATDYYVTPTDSSNPDCPVGEPCFTVDHYAQEFGNSSYYGRRLNITLVFLQGTHNLAQDFDISEAVAENLVFRGISDDSSVVVILNADISTHGTVSMVVFKSLTITGSSFNANGGPHTVSISDPTSGIEIIVEQVLFRNTVLCFQNSRTDVAIARGNMQVLESVFVCSGIDAAVSAAQTNFSISILSSSFYSSGPSLSGSLMNFLCEDARLDLQIYNTTVQDTSAYTLGDIVCPPYRVGDIAAPFCDVKVLMARSLDENDVSMVNITKSTFSRTFGTAICTVIYQTNYCDVQVTDSTVANHRAGGLLVSLAEAVFSPNVNITMTNCSILNQTFGVSSVDSFGQFTASAGISLVSDAAFDIPNAMQNLKVVFENSTFSNNEASDSAVISLLRVTQITIHDCHFLNNTGSPIMAQVVKIS